METPKTGSDNIKWYRHLNKKEVVVAIVVVALLLGGIVALQLVKPTKKTPVCTEAVIKSSVSNFSFAKNVELAKIASGIKRSADYKNDPNCMYILTTNDYFSYNVSEAKSDLAQLKKDISEKNQLNPLLLKYSSVAKLSQNIDLINTIYQQNMHNSQELSPIPPTYTNKTNK